VKVGANPLLVTTVQPNSPAGKAGLQTGDAILEVNGKTPRSFIDFSDLLAANPGSEAKMAIQRGSVRKELSLRLVPEKSVFNAQLIRDRLGLSLEALTPQTAARYGVGASDGFIVSGVQEGSPAAAAPVSLQGVLVTALDGQTPPDLTAAAKLIYAKKKGEPMQLEIIVREHRGAFNFLQQLAVELVPR